MAETQRKMNLQQTRELREGKKKPAKFPVIGGQFFKVYVGATQIGFSTVSNVQQQQEHEALVEGGLNGYVHILNKPNSSGGTLTLEKGIALGPVTELMQTLSPGTRISVPVTITLYHQTDKGEQPVRSWGIDDGVVTGWSVEEFSAMGSEVAIERLEITHSGLTEIEV